MSPTTDAIGTPLDRLDGPLKLRFAHIARTEDALFGRVEQLVDQLE